MAKPTPRELEVLNIVDVTASMRRITLGGANMASFPAEQSGAYIKFMFPREDGKPLVRTYTVRAHRNNEIDVDFVVHESPGPASRWAAETVVGENVLVGGPGPRKLIHSEADWYLFAGDMTALPAISVNLEILPDDTRGYVIIEVLSEDDIQNLEKPDNIELHWVVNKVPDPNGDVLLKGIQQLPWLAGSPAVWAATEFSSMRKLRQYFRDEKSVARTHLYVSSYWKMGRSEDQHKIDKKEDAQANE